MVRSRVVECILQRQTSERKRGLALTWDEDLTRLARDPSLSTDHRIRVCIHRGEWISVQVALDTETNVPIFLGWQLLHRRRFRECLKLMEDLMPVARKEAPHQADYARKLIQLAREEVHV